MALNNDGKGYYNMHFSLLSVSRTFFYSTTFYHAYFLKSGVRYFSSSVVWWNYKKIVNARCERDVKSFKTVANLFRIYLINVKSLFVRPLATSTVFMLSQV